jgi:hypothetical protein
VAAELASQVTSIVEVRADDGNVSVTSNGSLSWLGIEKEGRLVVSILGGVISVVLIVQGQLNSGLSPVVGRRGNTCSLRGVENLGTDWGNIEGREGAKGGVRDVQLAELGSQRLEVVATQSNYVTTSLWADVRVHDSNLWGVVVPKGYSVFALLLAVQRYTEWHWALNNVGGWSPALDEARSLHFGGHSFRTEGASDFVAEVDETLSPDLNSSVAVFWPLLRLDGGHLDGLVVVEWSSAGDI